MAWLSSVRGVLLDVDGTLLVGNRAVPGAADALERLRARGIARRVVTNITRMPRSAVAELLRGQGIAVDDEEVLAPSVLARKRILASGRPRAALFVPPGSRVDFTGVEIDEARPDWVVLGDLGRGFTWEALNRAFGYLRGGASLLALHRNRYWHAGDEGILLDAGPFVAALECAAGVEAEVVGKPALPFFRLVLDELGVPPAEAMMVGDDAENDGAGAAAAGCRTALVRTGKFGDGDPAPRGFTPDLVLDSIADLG